MLFVRLLSSLPFWVLYAFSDFLFVVSYYLVRYRRKMVWKNLKNSFPEKSAKELQKIEKQFYRNLCDYALEMLKLLTISREELAKRMRYTDTAAAEKFKAQNQSVFILASHHFNWEWLLVASSFSYPFQSDFIYQPQHSKFFNRFSLLSRTRFGAFPIKRDEVARVSVKRKDILRGIAIVADQYPGYKKDKKYSLEFLNQETLFFYGANQLAVLMQFPVLFAEIHKIKRGYYEVKLVEIAAPPYEKNSHVVVEQYAKAVEKLIRQDPTTWLWSHNRWKKRHLHQDTVIVKGSTTGDS
ncbi:lysophospholipid acyltransferase family protein [Parachryseolinea silvisoli]|jgi:Kdo2-lipid IVA lauroyltransferase/acyltransferase|uniref:lysophospholipid acyltransferase family protein n=1 Tax=Parachryseolinea silvisoli TaxID=2873601 RepID=UPI002265CA09|nr:lysophospholipid acyltransferase family protein [Parachryseolinea silvisoli]MCD9016372.1 lysophospholipid acyltransferase family protein [Parachryseolinea silvisoli]